MYDALWSRERATDVIRRVVQEDAWLGRYALLLACEMLDLGKVNQLATALSEAAETPQGETAERLRLLTQERFGR